MSLRKARMTWINWRRPNPPHALPFNSTDAAFCHHEQASAVATPLLLLEGFPVATDPLMCVFICTVSGTVSVIYIYIICLHYIWQCINYIYRTITYRYSEYLRLYFVSFLHRISYITGISYVFWHIACNIYMYFMISYIYIYWQCLNICVCIL